MTALLVCAALAGFALLYTLWVPREDVYVPPPPTELDHLREKKKVIYDNLKDLNFEYRTGKLSDDDYQQLKTGLQYEMALVMKNIEELEAKEPRKAVAAAAPAAAVAPRGTCAQCGHVNPAGHKHCSECGARLMALLLAALLLFCFAAVPANAQTPIEGRVQNGTTGKPVAGLPVSLLGTAQGHQAIDSAKTAADGSFRFAKSDAGGGMLMVQAEYAGIRYSEPVPPNSPRVEIKVFDSGAPASTVRVGERAVILQPQQGRLNVTELFVVNNNSSPPATYTPSGPGLRFFVPEGAGTSVQVAMAGAAGMSVPVETRPASGQPGVITVAQSIRPGESRLEISYDLPYSGSMKFETRALESVERTRLAVAQGVTVAGDGVRFVSTEPQMKFGIYDVATNDRWSVTLSGESTAPAAGAAAGGAGGTAEGGGSEITRVPSWVNSKLYLFLAGLLVVLGLGLARLWGQPVVVEARPGKRKS